MYSYENVDKAERERLYQSLQGILVSDIPHAAKCLASSMTETALLIETARDIYDLEESIKLTTDSLRKLIELRNLWRNTLDELSN